jgi:hypothetical protein
MVEFFLHGIRYTFPAERVRSSTTYQLKTADNGDGRRRLRAAS